MLAFAHSKDLERGAGLSFLLLLFLLCSNGKLSAQTMTLPGEGAGELRLPGSLADGPDTTSQRDHNPTSDSGSSKGSDESLAKKVAELESKLNKELERNSQKASNSPKPTPTVSDEKWNVRLGGHVQLDYVNWTRAAPQIVPSQDYFEFRRLRLVADGTGYEVFDFRLQMTLEPETIGEIAPAGNNLTPDVKDAYLSMNEIPFFGRFRIGNFFVPFSLEQVTNDTNNIFMERSIPTQGIFSPDREVGIAFYNASEDQRFTWSYGLFFDSISEGLKKRVDDNQGYRISGRLTWLPHYDENADGRSLMHLGGGVLHTDDQDDRVRFRARPQIHEGPRIIDSGVLAADRYTTGNMEMAIVHQSLAIQGEAFFSNVELSNLPNESVFGSYLHGSYFLTGENRIFERFGQHGAQFGRNVPKRNFRWTSTNQSPGAIELKARWSYLDLDRVGSGRYNDMTLGFNWYWSDRTRVMFDWIHPVTSRRSIFGETNSDLLAMRFDFNW